MLTKAPKKICVVITARPSYSRVRSLLKAIKFSNSLELQLVLAGPSVLEKYGDITDFVKKDGFDISSKVYSVVDGENKMAMAKTTGLGIIELTNVFNILKPNIVITIADRFETISTAISASYQNIPLGHLQGGEVTGNIDEKVRHAITKLSDLHFVSSEDAKQRVLRLGENPKFVFNTGCPSIDIANKIHNDKRALFNPYKKYGGVGSLPDLENGYVIAMQHPVTNEYEKARSQVKKTLNAIHKLDIPCLWFWPNIDAGSDGTAAGIRHFREMNDLSHFHFFKNMDPEDFLNLVKNSKCLVGNSSVGIRECSFLGVPVVNIGSRQSGRARGINVIDTSYDEIQIRRAIQNQLSKGKYKQDFTYGKANAGKKIANILEIVDPSSHKRIEY
ncbi:UDP-N-acetylglucosamine 2-epimerase [Candidatus Marinimicrobia bacterium]|nr:UDP-N-acetylglucosamine 2-epimerase [Candidatus Neomarinimicrobiota bacterium]